jgi:hypothetical protein
LNLKGDIFFVFLWLSIFWMVHSVWRVPWVYKKLIRQVAGDIGATPVYFNLRSWPGTSGLSDAVLQGDEEILTIRLV